MPGQGPSLGGTAGIAGKAAGNDDLPGAVDVLLQNFARRAGDENQEIGMEPLFGDNNVLHVSY